MTITRLAAAGTRRTWFRPAPRCLLGTAAPAGRRRGSPHAARTAAAIVALAAVAALTVAGLAERTAVAALAVMLRRLLAAGRASVGIRPMLATANVANAVSVSVPLAGPALATAFTSRRFARQGADAPLAGGFAANARAVLDDLDSRGIRRAVLVGHSYGGGVALSAAALAPGRVVAVVLLASVGPGCVTCWDRLLAAPGAGWLCAQVAWR